MFTFFKSVTLRVNPNPLSRVTGKQVLDWRKWKGTVTGTTQDIKRALKTLKREPIDAEELSELILNQRRELLKKGLKTSKENYKKFGY